jgi:hypothetical protein
MGDKPVTIELTVGDNISFTVSKTKVKVAAGEEVTISWSLGKDTSWWMSPQGIVFKDDWPGPQPALFDDVYSVTYQNTEELKGTYRYTINVQSRTTVPNTLSLDPEVENSPPHPVYYAKKAE